MTKKNILIATGGTGGHVFPAYSLASYLIKNNYNVEISTDKRGYLFLKKYEDLKIIYLPSSPLKKGILNLLLSVVTIFYSMIRSFIFLLFNRPSIIFGMGGYSSFPLCVAAYILRIKFVIYESNLIIGKANKYLTPLTKKIFVSYKELEGISKKYEDKVFRIGNIVREEIIEFRTNDRKLDQSNSKKILVLGGSQGAKVFAESLPEVFEKLKNSNFPIKIYQQCQKTQNIQLSQFYKNKKISHEIFNFTDNIIKYYSKVDLVITRSGASVLGELINIKVPFILIPLPTSADNHQYKNAQFYNNKGCGFLLNEKDIKNKLFDLITFIFKDKLTIKKILSNQSQFSDKNVFRNLENQLKEILNEKN
tara:strand:+ start:11420 stop:12511 length:1092 start_codon:yes stop_codon:yes gene_type:complete